MLFSHGLRYSIAQFQLLYHFLVLSNKEKFRCLHFFVIRVTSHSQPRFFQMKAIEGNIYTSMEQVDPPTINNVQLWLCFDHISLAKILWCFHVIRLSIKCHQITDYREKRDAHFMMALVFLVIEWRQHVQQLASLLKLRAIIQRITNSQCFGHQSNGSLE